MTETFGYQCFSRTLPVSGRGYTLCPAIERQQWRYRHPAVDSALSRKEHLRVRDTQAVLGDIINEAKMANAIVQEVLDFVRPIRLQVERTGVADAVQSAIHLA